MSHKPLPRINSVTLNSISNHTVKDDLFPRGEHPDHRSGTQWWADVQKNLQAKKYLRQYEQSARLRNILEKKYQWKLN